MKDCKDFIDWYLFWGQNWLQCYFEFIRMFRVYKQHWVHVDEGCATLIYVWRMILKVLLTDIGFDIKHIFNSDVKVEFNVVLISLECLNHITNIDIMFTKVVQCSQMSDKWFYRFCWLDSVLTSKLNSMLHWIC